ncbi:MAG TPA: GNAT family N-acetyltransferase [Acidobacteriaceae bacterium]|nr:GNAT family N-acetyltransferase [Acidobacteriaceae bacterium]
MPETCIRPATAHDLPRLTEIYNYYVVHTPVTFDLESYTVEQRAPWFNQFATTGRHRLLVAVENDLVLGYAGTTRFRAKAAYDTTVEATIYCAKEAVGKRLGQKLFAALFESIAQEDIHRIVGGYTMPNVGSASLLERFQFQPVGIFRETGRKFGKYWDVAFLERPLHLPAGK